MALEDQVAQHYAHGTLEQVILAALAATGKPIDRLAPADLAPVDEFHIGGRAATIEFAGAMGVRAGRELLDIGCGLGGASRYFAHELRCRVVGIDLTADYVAAAKALARRVGLADQVSYQQASALALPFAAARFDGAYMMHVGMNIADKAALFAEARRVMKPGGVFGIYDVMRESAGELRYPLPWAATAATSFLADAATYRRLLEAAGFMVEAVRSRRDFAIAFFREGQAKAAQAGPPPLGLHLLMGKEARQKGANMIANLEAGLVSPTEIIARAT